MKRNVNGVEVPLSTEEEAEYEADQQREAQRETVRSARQELRELDMVLPRAVEDLMVAQGTDETLLPVPMQQRLARKRQLRLILQG